MDKMRNNVKLRKKVDWDSKT